MTRGWCAAYAVVIQAGSYYTGRLIGWGITRVYSTVTR